MRTAVLGAGLAGLAAAYELASAGREVVVLEAAPRVGGMAASWRVGPFWLEHGPHRFFTRSPELRAHLYELLDGEVVVRRRSSRIHLLGRYFDYPLRLGNVARNLPPALLARAFLDYGLARARERVRPRADEHFEAWVEKRFGRTLYELFFGTYTEKTWGIPPRRISAEWASQRISQASLWDAVRRTIRPPRDGEVRGLAQEFLYPASGGVGRIARQYERRLRAMGARVECGARVTAVEVPGGRAAAVRFAREGAEERVAVEHVLSTIPLPVLARALEPGPGPEALAAAARLDHVAIVFVYLEVARPSVSPDHWIYLPEPHLAVHRVSEFKNFCDSAAPGDRTALCCEITCRVGDATWRMDLEEAARVAARDLERAGLVRAGETRPLDLARLSHAYPVYEVGYKGPLAAAREAVRAVPNLTTTGRQGLFRYNNMDHSIAMGRAAARRLGAGGEAAAELVGAGAELYG